MQNIIYGCLENEEKRKNKEIDLKNIGKLSSVCTTADLCVAICSWSIFTKSATGRVLTENESVQRKLRKTGKYFYFEGKTAKRATDRPCNAEKKNVLKNVMHFYFGQEKQRVDDR